MTTKSYIDEKVAEFEKRIACNKHEGFSGPITCDACVLGSGELFFVREALQEAYSKGREDILGEVLKELPPERIIHEYTKRRGDGWKGKLLFPFTLKRLSITLGSSTRQ